VWPCAARWESLRRDLTCGARKVERASSLDPPLDRSNDDDQDGCRLESNGEDEDKGDQAGAEQGSGVSPLAHHAPQGYAGKVHRLRACARCEVGDRDGCEDYKISDWRRSAHRDAGRGVSQSKITRTGDPGWLARRQAQFAGVVRSKRLEPPRVAPLAPQHDGKLLTINTDRRRRIDGS
jgi:hypothetical protein